MHTIKNHIPLRAALACLLAFLLTFLTACSGAAPAQSPADAEEETLDLMDIFSDQGSEYDPADLSIQKEFIDEPFYDGVITTPEEALEAVYSVIDRIGGDEKTELAYDDIVYNNEGNVFYSFAQVCDDYRVERGNVKLVADKDGKAIALISSLVIGVESDPESTWVITQEEAEAIVSENYLDPGARVLTNATEQALVPDVYTNGMRYVWVVYTNNVSKDIEKAYISHYISGAGEYLYSLPVTEPGNEEALSGSVAAFAFEGYEKSEWSGTVKDIDGLERTISVPVMIDSATGTQYLGDPERRILCADCTDFTDNETLTPVISNDGTWINNELITYEMFIRVWDFYDSIGWHGPDGKGTPTLVLVDLRDKKLRTGR